MYSLSSFRVETYTVCPFLHLFLPSTVSVYFFHIPNKSNEIESFSSLFPLRNLFLSITFLFSYSECSKCSLSATSLTFMLFDAILSLFALISGWKVIPPSVCSFTLSSNSNSCFFLARSVIRSWSRGPCWLCDEPSFEFLDSARIEGVKEHSCICSRFRCSSSYFFLT